MNAQSAPAVQPVLSIRHLSKSFGSRRILTDINLDVTPGEIFGFLGPNGSGKTTTIKLMLGLLHIDSGEISICGYNVASDFEAAMSCVGGIIENPEMYKYLSGRENLELYRRMYDGVPPERTDELLRLVRLEARAGDKISKYSLGMRQRLGIAQAIMDKPELLLLDEPMNGLDNHGVDEMRRLFKTLKEQGTTIIIASHIAEDIQILCDAVTYLDHGRIVEEKV